MTRFIAPLSALLLSLSPALVRGADRPKSPPGQAETQVDGKWITVEYSRPILRGRTNIFGSGADYGKTVNGDAPVWRLGANRTTTLTTEVPLKIGGKTLAAGTYDLFVDLKESGWTLIISTQPVSDGYPPKGGKLWGSYGYDPKFDVVRVPLMMTPSTPSVDQLTISFVDVSNSTLKLQIAWEHTVATALFEIPK
jgi:hypothetical protein